MDIGIWMGKATLAHKLEARNEKNPEEAWNLSQWPKGLSEEEENRLFVASGGYWRGYFKLANEVLFNPRDQKVPYTLLFNTRTWTPIPKTPARRFRGFTYKVPPVPPSSRRQDLSRPSGPTVNQS